MNNLVTSESQRNVSFDSKQSIGNENDFLAAENAMSSPNDLPKICDGEYCVQTPKRETYFVPTPSYFLRSSLKRKPTTATDVGSHVYKTADFQANLSSKTWDETPKRFRQNQSSSKLAFKTDRRKNGASTKNLNTTVFFGASSRKTQLVPIDSGQSSKSNCISKMSKVAEKSNILLKKKAGIAQHSVDIIHNVMEVCQNVRRSRTVETSQKPREMLTRADALQNDSILVGNVTKSSPIFLQRNRSLISKLKSVSACERSQHDNPINKKSKVALVSQTLGTKTSVPRKSVADFRMNSVTAEYKQNSRSFKPFKAQPVPPSNYNKPTIIKKSINLTVPRSPMFSSKFAVKRKAPLQENNSPAPPNKFYHPTPKFSAAFKPKLSNVKTIPQPFSFHFKDQERLLRRSERIKKLSKPEVLCTTFKAQPVPASVLHAKALPTKQAKQPTKIEPFEFQCKTKSRKAKKIPKGEENSESQVQTTFRANRDYEKILNAKPWKPRIQRKRCTQPQQFTFQSEARIQKREMLKRNKGSEIQKENQEVGVGVNHKEQRTKSDFSRKPFLLKKAQNLAANKNSISKQKFTKKKATKMFK